MVISLHLPHPDRDILPPRQVGLVIGTSPQSTQPGPLPLLLRANSGLYEGFDCAAARWPWAPLCRSPSDPERGLLPLMDSCGRVHSQQAGREGGIRTREALVPPLVLGPSLWLLRPPGSEGVTWHFLLTRMPSPLSTLHSAFRPQRLRIQVPLLYFSEPWSSNTLGGGGENTGPSVQEFGLEWGPH